ncbi:MAG TPA: cytochrome c peroxidase [Bacteroidia bacterium]|nr:cytochrome c peroxidase [Bacteroidia bacterium]
MKTKLSLTAILFVIVIAIISCKKYRLDSDNAAENYSAEPVLPEQPYNYSNSGNDHLASLGRVLFYDKNMSLNNSVSCASCHQQSRAFCDNMQFSVGLENGKTSRNSPSIFAKSGRMFWDGRANGIQDLVLKPIKNHVEMKFENLTALAKKISSVQYYAPLFEKAFGSSTVDSNRIKLALAEFLNNFNFSENKFSRSQKNLEALTASEAHGKNLFFGKGRCSGCHHIENQFAIPSNTFSSGYGFTNADFNIGLDKEYSDNGLGAITGNTFDNGKFMVPVLLNVEYTAPYMHDGRFKTLEEVVEHYSTGIQNHPNLDFQLKDVDFNNMNELELLEKLDVNHDGDIDGFEMSRIPPVKLNFTLSEKRALVDFLKTLSDPSILTEPKFNNPFVLK